MVKGLIFLQTATCIQVNIIKVSLKEKANTLGRMDHSTLESSRTVSNMEKGNGSQAKVLKAILMKVIIATIRRMDTESSLGQVVTSTKVSIRMMKETDMAR